MSTISDFTSNSARANVEAAIQKARTNESFNAILALTEERALERADKVDAGEITGILAGVPFIAKDNFLTFGAPTTAASRFLETFEAPIQATAIEKLEAEGAICIGKANLDAFAHGDGGQPLKEIALERRLQAGAYRHKPVALGGKVPAFYRILFGHQHRQILWETHICGLKDMMIGKGMRLEL